MSVNFIEDFNLVPNKDLYDVLMHSTDEERDALCKTDKYQAMCALLVYDRFLYNNPSDLALHRLGRAQFKVVLDSFPKDFTQALIFIRALKPAFIYTDEFKAYVNGMIEITAEDEQTTKYSMGRYSYYITRNKNGIIQAEEWKRKTHPRYRREDTHRENGPALIFYDDDGNKTEEVWFSMDKPFRRDGPDVIKYYKSGNVKSEEWTSIPDISIPYLTKYEDTPEKTIRSQKFAKTDKRVRRLKSLKDLDSDSE